MENAEGRETGPQQIETVSESSVIILPSIIKQLQTLAEVKDIIAAHYLGKQQLLAGIQFVQNGLRRKKLQAYKQTTIASFTTNISLYFALSQQ